MVRLQYIEHFTDRDLALLARVAGISSDAGILAAMRDDPDFLDRVLRQPDLFDHVFRGEEEALLRVSPFLAFTVLTYRGAHDLAHLPFVEEWIGPGRHIPSFAVDDLRSFVSDEERRLYLSGLLASFTRVASGSFWVQSARGWRRKRYSDLDPLRLLELLESLPETDRPPVYQRLGDLTLFLTGVFPDYAAGHVLPRTGRRLQRHLRLADDRMDSGRSPGTSAEMSLLEHVGSRAYRLAWDGTGQARTAQVLEELSERFGQARRVLNFLAGRYLFPYRDQWFNLAR